MRLLLVEDEIRVAGVISRGLREASYAVDVARDAESALEQLGTNDYDLVLLDVGLPSASGFDVCREARAHGLGVPILMLTARDSVDDRVTGLDCGADDYLTKPYDFKELLARIRALLRRHKEVRPDILRIGDLTLDTIGHRATRAGRQIALTAKEYALLEFFMLRAGQVVGREEISEHVWDQNFDAFSNTIDVYVRRLRRKIDEGFPVPLIHTRRGEGYLFSIEGDG